MCGKGTYKKVEITHDDIQRIMAKKSLSREWKAADIVTDIEGTKYLIVGVGEDTIDNEKKVIYKRVDGQGSLLITSLKEFNKPVDKTLFKNTKQTYMFELLETHTF